MASVAELRQLFPQYAEIPDGLLADAIYQDFYSDLPRNQFDEQLGVKAAPPLPDKETVGMVLPIAKNNETGAIRLAVPRALSAVGDAVGALVEDMKFPGKVYRGEALVPQSGNMPGGEDTSGIGNVTGLATIGATGSPAMQTGKAIARRAAGYHGPDITVKPYAAESAVVDDLARAAREADAASAVPPEVQLMEGVTDDAARATRDARVSESTKSDLAGNINLGRIFAPEDVKDAIRQTAAENEGFAAARRGVVSHEDTRDMAGLLGMSGEDLLSRRIGQAFNAEELFAARQLMVGQATKVRDLARRVKDGTEAERAQFAEEVTRLAAIQEQVAGATAEAGRALSQFRMLAGGSKEQVARIVEASKAQGIDDMARMIAEMDDPAQVAHFTANAYKATSADMLYEAWVNALLSGPTTHAANIASNSLVALWSVPEAALAAGISKLTGSGIYGSEAIGRVAGIVDGAKEGIVSGWRAYRTEMPSDMASKLENRSYQAIPSVDIGGLQIGGKQVRIPGRLLMAEDEFFKAIGTRQEINQLAIRQARSEGLKGEALTDRISELKANPTAEMQEAARIAAEKQTFTNPLGTAGQAVQEMKQAAPLVGYVIPFIRTPVNVVKFAAERSPLAPVFKEVRQNLAGANGPIARDNQLARIALGSAVSAVAASLAAEGTITGGGPSDPQKRALLRADGWQPYSLRIGDSYYSYSRFEPMGMLMGVAADYVELQKAMQQDEKANLAALIMGSVSRNLVSKTWLQGPSDLIQAVQDPERYGPRYVQRLVGTVVPTAVAQYANYEDPYLREARTILDAVRSRIPGEREKLFIRRDVFGEPIKREGALGPDLFSPIYQSAAKNDPAIAELLRLNLTPGRVSRKIRGAELTDAEFDDLSRLSGQAMKRGLDALVALPKWRELPEAAQVEAINTVMRQSRDLARTTVMAKYPDLMLRIKAAVLKSKRLPSQQPESEAVAPAPLEENGVGP